jgi:hypothetical protein
LAEEESLVIYLGEGLGLGEEAGGFTRRTVVLFSNLFSGVFMDWREFISRPRLTWKVPLLAPALSGVPLKPGVGRATHNETNSHFMTSFPLQESEQCLGDSARRKIKEFYFKCDTCQD